MLNIEKLQELGEANVQIGTSFIRQEGSKILIVYTSKLITRVLHKASQPNTRLKEASFARFQGTVERVQEYVRNISTQHRVQQFFTEDDIRRQLHEFHTQLGASYNSLTDDTLSSDKPAKDAEKEDIRSINDYMDGIGGDVTKVVRILACDDPPAEVMSALRKRVQVGRKDVGPASLLRDFIKWIDRDWFWLTFTSDSRQEIKGPLTRVLPDIIPAIQDRLANDDRIALTSDDWNTLQKVNRLFTVLDNAKDPAVVQLFRSALAETNLRDKLRDVKF